MKLRLPKVWGACEMCRFINPKKPLKEPEEIILPRHEHKLYVCTSIENWKSQRAEPSVSGSQESPTVDSAYDGLFSN